MRLRVLLVNPWIYDFAATDLWSRPLGLMRVAECLSGFDMDLSFIDCCISSGSGSFGKGKYPKEEVNRPVCLKGIPRVYGRYGISVDDFRNELQGKAPFDIVFVTSIMSYWYPGVQKVIGMLREMRRDMPIVLGGIYATLWHRHALETSGADYVHTGQLGEEISVILNTFGFRVKRRGASLPFHRLPIHRPHPFWPLLTSSGCPYSCSYCGSGLLNRTFVQRPAEEVVREIRERHHEGIRDFVLYDDALLFDADAHIKPILRGVIDSGISARFHCPNGLHARFIDNGLAGLMKAAGFTTLRLGLETLNERRQGETGGKVSSSDFERAVVSLRKNGFAKQEAGAYLMYGLPGQGLDEVKHGVDFLRQLDVRIHLTEYSPIPGTRCWEELAAEGIVGHNTDPLLTNNTIFSYLHSGYDPEELDRIRLSVKTHNAL